MIKNKYILPEEFKQLIKNIPEKYNNMKAALFLVYDQGYRIGIALKESGVVKSCRTVERVVKKYSKGLISMQDLRRSYSYAHPKFQEIKRRNGIPPRIRWKVLVRDNFRCVACGKHSRDTILHVDHIIPESKGGKTELANLRTLCGECNMGRGNLMIDLV